LIAAKGGHVDSARELLNSGAKLGMSDKFKQTALHKGVLFSSVPLSHFSCSMLSWTRSNG